MSNSRIWFVLELSYAILNALSKFLRKLFDTSANQQYPKPITELALDLYEGRLANCLKEGDKGWPEKTTN